MINKILCFFGKHDYSLEYTFKYKHYPPFPYFVCERCGKIKTLINEGKKVFGDRK